MLTGGAKKGKKWKECFVEVDPASIIATAIQKKPQVDEMKIVSATTLWGGL